MPVPYYTLDSLRAGNSIGYLTKRCGIVVAQLAERNFGAQEVSFTQWVVLAQLTRQPHMTPTELRKHLGIDLGALTRIVDDLLDKKLVSRERSETDRRAVHIELTAEGHRLAEAAMPLVVELNNRLVEILTKKETETLIGLLQRMLSHMESALDETPEEPSQSTPTARAPARRAPAARRRHNP